MLSTVLQGRTNQDTTDQIYEIYMLNVIIGRTYPDTAVRIYVYILTVLYHWSNQDTIVDFL